MDHETKHLSEPAAAKELERVGCIVLSFDPFAKPMTEKEAIDFAKNLATHNQGREFIVFKPARIVSREPNKD